MVNDIFTAIYFAFFKTASYHEVSLKLSLVSAIYVT